MSASSTFIARLGTMASGHVCIEFDDAVTYDSFPEFASRLAKRIGATVKQKDDAVDIRIWEMDVGGVGVRLVYEDFPSQASLESSSAEADDFLRQIAKRLA
jgi:Protein of unknown function (DUF3630)